MSTSGEKVPVMCPACDRRLLVPAGTIGKQGRCPQCQTVFTLEQLYEAEPVAAAPSNDGFASNNNYSFGSTGNQPVANPFGDDDYKLQATPQAPAPMITPAAFNPGPTTYGGSYAPKKESTFWGSSVLGGLAMMAGGVVITVLGLLAERIIFWGPILFIIGLVTFFKGLFSGNLAGE